MKTSILALVTLTALHCSKEADESPTSFERYPPDTRYQVTISRGVWGNVWLWEGNFMPTGCGKITPVVRTVYAYQLTKSQQVEWVESGSPLFRRIFSQIVDSTQSNSTGFFQMTLPPGQYSFIIREDSLYYANSMDGSGNIRPGTVKQDSLTYIHIDITYKAVF